MTGNNTEGNKHGNSTPILGMFIAGMAFFTAICIFVANRATEIKLAEIAAGAAANEAEIEAIQGQARAQARQELADKAADFMNERSENN